MTSDQELARIMELMPYGLYIVGSTGEEGPNGRMADWLTQVSFSPRLVLVAIENDAQTLRNIRSEIYFTINFFAESRSSMDLAARFSAPYSASKVGGPTALGVHPKLTQERHRLNARGCPVLEAAMAWLECEAVQINGTGDHTLVIGEVKNGVLLREAAPLTSTFTGWAYSG
jgi:flavin reductase (DIM6/NTAB) family NADH-FMN oxidoreductase RutF